MNHKILLAKLFIWLITSGMLLILPIGSIAQTTKPSPTVKQNYLSLKDGKSLSQKEFNALKPKISKYFEGAEDDLYFDNQDWVYYKGNLKVNGNFFNSSKGVIVEGNLIVEGLYYDEESALLVTGNMQAHNVASQYPFYVGANLTSKGIVYAYYNDHSFEVGNSLISRVFINYDRGVNCQNIQAQFNIDSEDDSTIELLGLARNLLPELYLDNFYGAEFFPNKNQTLNDYEFYRYPTIEAVINFTQKNSNIFREKIAPTTVFTSELAIASTPAKKSDLIKNTANNNIDILTAIFYASRHDLPDEAIRNLIQKKNDAVLQALSLNPTLPFKYFNEISDLSANATGHLLKHKNVTKAFIASLVKHNNPLHRVEVAKNIKLNPQYFETLALDSSLDVRNAVFNRHKLFEASAKVIEANINSNNDDILKIILADNTYFKLAQYQHLAAHSSARVRNAVARNLISESIFLRYKNSTEAERLTVLQQLSSDDNLEVKVNALAGLTAKEQEAAYNNTPNNQKLAFLIILAPAVKSKKLAFQIIESKDDEAMSKLTQNEWLSEEVVTKIIENYIQEHAQLKDRASYDQEHEISPAMESLMYSGNISPANIEKISSYCFSNFYPPHFCKVLARFNLPRKILDQFSNIKNKALRTAMYLSIPTQAHATSEEITKLELSNTFGVNRFLSIIRSISDTLFWYLLSESIVDDGPIIAAANSNTPDWILKNLARSSNYELKNFLLENPTLPIDLKKKVVLNRKYFWSEETIDTDFYLNVLNGKIKTPIPLTAKNKEILSMTLRSRIMDKQFQ